MKTTVTRITRSIAVFGGLAMGLGLAFGVAPAFADNDGDTPPTPTDKAPVPPAPPTSPDPNAAAARKACTDAMNADKEFAKQIVAVADENAVHRREEATVQAHQDAQDHIVKNEKHVIYAYSAMWVVAALFVVFLWRRQLRLSAEILQLRRELADAMKSSDPDPGPESIEPLAAK